MNANQMALTFINANIENAPELVVEVLNKLKVKLEKNMGKAEMEDKKKALRLQVAESRKALKEYETAQKAERESQRNAALLAKQLKEKEAIDKAAARESKKVANESKKNAPKK